eukprot:TRINITY_DN4845_c0_g1_i1.p1 TRINITY_DN4845_c0_g1~~TRINITY_DN4845_c0_g1_i1.p1  ORF type:complete len:381 (+),score=110.93 TRINITY_DN4845_c0_g1_i1:324-1466(+)
MGNNQTNYVKDLGVAPRKKVSSKEYAAIWQRYDRNKNRLTTKQAKKFLSDFAAAVQVTYDKEKAERMISDADVDRTGYLNYEQFKKLFFAATQDAKVDLSQSLAVELNVASDSDDDEQTKTGKKFDLRAMKDKIQEKQAVPSNTNTNQQPNPSTITTPAPVATPPVQVAPPIPPTAPQGGLESIFETYKAIKEDEPGDEDPGDVMRGMGTLQYSQDLGITDDKDPSLLLIAFKLQVNQPAVWQFSREEFMRWNKFGCKTLEDMQKKCKSWRDDLKREDEFKNFYLFVFDYLREERKILSTEEAIVAWEILGMESRWPLMKDWIDYLKKHQAINRDTWRLLYTFIKQHPRDLTNYDPDGCWPSAIDDFVETMREGSKKEQE